MQPKVSIVPKYILIQHKIIIILLVMFMGLCLYLLFENLKLKNNLRLTNNKVTILEDEKKYISSVSSITIKHISNLINNQKILNESLLSQIEEREIQLIIHNPSFQIYAFLHKYYPNMNISEKKEYVDAFTKHSIDNNIPPLLMASICKRESNFKSSAVGTQLASGFHAKGVCQIHPKYWVKTIREIGYANKNDLFIVDANVYAGTKAFQHFYNTRGDINGALTGYVGGNHSQYNHDVISTYTDFMVWLYNLSTSEIMELAREQFTIISYNY